MRLRLIALGLAAAAFGASGAQAAPVIPYLSQGQGLTPEQRALFKGAEVQSPKVIPYLSQGQGITPEQRALLNGEVSNPAGTPCISVSGRCIELDSKAVADPAKSVASRYDDHRGEALAKESKTFEQFSLSSAIAAARYDDHRGNVVADVPLSSTIVAGYNDHPGGVVADASKPSATATGTDDGFNWSDASVGAGSTLGLVLLAGMAAFTIRRSRRNQLAT